MEVLDVLRDAIAGETGFELGGAQADVPFAEIGLEPLSILNIIDIVTDRTGIDFPASLFRDCNTLSEVGKKVSGGRSINAQPSPPEKIPSDGAVIADAFTDLGKLVGKFATEAGCASFSTTVYPAQKQLVLAYTTEAFTRLGEPLDRIPAGSTVTHPPGILPKHRRVFDGAIFQILQDGGLVVAHPSSGTYTRTAKRIDPTPSSALYTALLQAHPRHANTHKLLNATGAVFADCLAGAADPIKVLFSRNKDLLTDFYTNAPMSLAASRHLTMLMQRVFEATLAREGRDKPIEILEIGAGLGGTTKFMLEMLISAGIPFRYVFTDISPAFFAAAKNRYRDLVLPAGSAIEYQVLDVEKGEGLPAGILGSFHCAISTNCIHATRNLVNSCGNIRKLLRPGGYCALVEFTQRLYWLDLVFGLLDGWWLFDDDRTHCTVDEKFWMESLTKAGFGHVHWVKPEKCEDRPNPQLLVACTD